MSGRISRWQVRSPGRPLTFIFGMRAAISPGSIEKHCIGGNTLAIADGLPFAYPASEPFTLRSFGFSSLQDSSLDHS